MTFTTFDDAERAANRAQIHEAMVQRSNEISAGTAAAVALMEPVTGSLNFLDSLAEAAQVSIAISLKRIADEMDRRVITTEPQSDVA